MRIVTIVSDTFRYDHLSALGLENCKSPELDDLMAEAVAFDECYTGSFPTIPHRTDLFTGQFVFPWYGWQPLAPDRKTIALELAGKGYVTQMLTDTPHLLRGGYNFDRGFIAYYWTRGQESDMAFTHMNTPISTAQKTPKTRITPQTFGKTLVDIAHWTNDWWRWEEDRFVARTCRLASRWLEENYKAKDFYLHVDLFDPHEPWDPPEHLVRHFDPDYDGPPMYHPNYGYASEYTPAELKNLAAHYKANAMLVSKWVGYLIRKMKDLQIYDETILVFHSDHGHYIGEHNRAGKSNLSERDDRGPWPLYDEISHVPLFVRAPGAKHGTRRKEMIQAVDIMPTLFELSGVKSDVNFHGHSLVPLLHGETGKWPRKVAVSSDALGSDPDGELHWTTLTDPENTFHIGGRPGDFPEMYDRKKDPDQKTNIFEENRDKARAMMAEFLKMLKQLKAPADRIETFETRMKRAGIES